MAWATSGSELNYSDTYLYLRNADETESATIYATAIERSREEVPGLGYNVTVAYEFDTSDIEFDVADWGFIFNGTLPHLSLDAVRLDLNSVPAPGALLAFGLAPMMRRRRN